MIAIGVTAAATVAALLFFYLANTGSPDVSTDDPVTASDEWPSTTECSPWTDTSTPGVQIRACALATTRAATGTLQVRNTTDTDIRVFFETVLSARDTPSGEAPAESSVESSGGDQALAGETTDIAAGDGEAEVTPTTQEVKLSASWSNEAQFDSEPTLVEVTLTRTVS